MSRRMGKAICIGENKGADGTLSRQEVAAN